MKIKVKFVQETAMTVLNKETATSKSFITERIKLVSDLYLLTITDIFNYYKELGFVNERTKFGFSDCWGHATYQYSTIEELQTATAGYIERAEKEIEFVATFFNNRVNIQPQEKTEAEIKAHQELVRSFGE